MADEDATKKVAPIDHSNQRESTEHNFALKQVYSARTVLTNRRDDYSTDPDCPAKLISSFDFALDALNILSDDIRDFNDFCTARRHNRNRLNPKEKKPRVRRINVI